MSESGVPDSGLCGNDLKFFESHAPQVVRRDDHNWKRLAVSRL